MQALRCVYLAIWVLLLVPAALAQDSQDSDTEGVLEASPLELRVLNDVEKVRKSAADLSDLANESEFSDTDLDTTLFDLYLGDSFRGAIITSYTEEWFKIEHPEDALEQLPALRDRDSILQLMRGKIASSRSISDIGKIRYDLSTFRIIIDLDSSQLYAKELELADRIRNPESKFSLIQRVGGSVSGEASETLNASITHQTTAGLGKYSFFGDGTYVKNDDYVITQLSASTIFGDYRAAGGLLQTQGQTFARSLEFTGAEVQNELELFQDQEALRGSSLEIFVPSRSRVEFFRAGRLLSVQILDFGLQEVDTTRFPIGSYEVDIVIREDNGNVIRDSRFFVKSGFLSVRSVPIFSLRGGQARDELDLLDQNVFEGTLNWRPFSLMEFGLAGVTTDEDMIGTLQINTLYRDFQLGLEGALSDEQDSGFRGSLSWFGSPFYASTSYLETFPDSNRQTTRAEIDSDSIDPLDPDAVPEEDKKALPVDLNTMSQERKTITGNVGVLFGNLKLEYSMNKNESETSPERYAIGPKFEWRIINKHGQLLVFDTSYLDTQDGDTLKATLRYRTQFDRWTFESNANSRVQPAQDESRLVNTASYDDKNFSGIGNRARFSNEVIRSEQNDNNIRVINSVENAYTNRFLDSRAFLRDSRGNNSDATNIGADLSSAFTIDQSGTFGISRPISQQSIIIVYVKSGSTDSPVEVLLNGFVIDTIRPGQRAVVGVQPYRQYKVLIRPAAEADLLGYETEAKQFVVFPGNIVASDWNIEKIFIALGRVVDAEGNPLTWQRIKGLDGYVFTEEDGSFQAEINGNEKLYIENKDFKCQLKLPAVERGEYFADYGDIPCLEA